MNILILGNGFDIAHKFKTSYCDFLDYCVAQLNDPMSETNEAFFTNIWIKHFNIRRKDPSDKESLSNDIQALPKLDDTWIDLEKEIYRVFKLRQSQFPLVINSTDYPKRFSMQYGDPNFSFYRFFIHFNERSISFTPKENSDEEEIYKKTMYIRINPEKENALEDETDGEYKIMDVYFKNSRGVINFLYDQLREFTKLFEDYLQKEISNKIKHAPKYRLSFKPSGLPLFNNDVHILNFNYTDTCEKLYGQQVNTNGNFNIKFYYVHGQVGVENCNLVLGTQSFNNKQINEHRNADSNNEQVNEYRNTDSNNEQFIEKLPTDFNIFQKHYQRHKYGTIEQYQDLLKEIKQSETEPIFHIIGHSLDRTDHNVLKHIFKANPNSKINIYYHDEEAQERLMNNINAIIGEEEVMAKVRFIHQHDDPRCILKKKIKLLKIALATSDLAC